MDPRYKRQFESAKKTYVYSSTRSTRGAKSYWKGLIENIYESSRKTSLWNAGSRFRKQGTTKISLMISNQSRGGRDHLERELKTFMDLTFEELWVSKNRLRIRLLTSM